MYNVVHEKIRKNIKKSTNTRKKNMFNDECRVK